MMMMMMTMTTTISRKKQGHKNPVRRQDPVFSAVEKSRKLRTEERSLDPAVSRSLVALAGIMSVGSLQGVEKLSKGGE